MEFENLLKKANQEKDSLRRLCLVAAFGISQYNCTVGRFNKPFNPILGETYELQPSEGTQYMAEQVSHHPPVSACYAKSESQYEYWMNTNMKTSFWGKSMEVKPLGF